MKDTLGTRMKQHYENRICEQSLPRRTYSILRLDGKSFHTYTRNFTKPFDINLLHAFRHAALHLAQEAMGVRFAYLQSDEMSFLLTDFNKEGTEAWFNGNIQKIVSVSASIVTAKFNSYMEPFVKSKDIEKIKLAYFDSRIFTIPDPTEVENYFIWRQKDCIKNSVQSYARKFFSHKELLEKNTNIIKQMLFEIKNPWENLANDLKNGCIIKKEFPASEGTHPSWIANLDVPIFTQERSFLQNLIPKYDIKIN